MNAGLFGGTFNPLHNGHIEPIRFVKERFGLDRVYFIPACTPPHKPDQDDLAAAGDRMDMVSDSVDSIPGFFASDMEVKRQGPSYTIDTIRQFKRQYREKVFLCLIMGSDAFFDITTWEKYIEIFNEIALVVMKRAGDKASMESMASFIRQGISEKYHMNVRRDGFVHPEKTPIFVADVPEIDISSTCVREMVKQGKSIRGMVPPPVEEIILKRGLYV